MSEVQVAARLELDPEKRDEIAWQLQEWAEEEGFRWKFRRFSPASGAGLEVRSIYSGPTLTNGCLTATVLLLTELDRALADLLRYRDWGSVKVTAKVVEDRDPPEEEDASEQ